MRVLIWASTLQADILALAQYLDRAPSTALMIVASEPRVFSSEPIAKARPFSCELLDRDDPETRGKAERFGADVVVVDNHFPDPGLAPRLCAMWHGLGFKARGRNDIEAFHRKVLEATGFDPREPNPNFMAQCYGQPDYLWRVDEWGLHPDNCRVIGMAYSDLLLDPPYGRADLRPRYPRISLGDRKVVLVSFTWHYGGIFAYQNTGGDFLKAKLGLVDPSAHEKRDIDFARSLFEGIRSEGADILLCLHDAHRYSPRLLDGIKDMAARMGGIEIREKDRHPDNLADLIASDVMVSNLSSFITYKYVMGDPTVHICPTTPGKSSIFMAMHRHGKLQPRAPRHGEALWMTAPEDNGGMTAYDIYQARAAVKEGLRDGSCCAERSADWLARHVYKVDGRSCERFAEALREFCARPIRAAPKHPVYAVERKLRRAARNLIG